MVNISSSTFKSKIIATSIHALLSLLVFLSIFLTVRYFWFPEPYFEASGGWQGAKIVAAINLILGPLLTFVVFSDQKKSTKLYFDLTVIVLMQLSALLFGIHTLYNERPIAAVFWEGSFYLVENKIFSQQGADLNKIYNFGDTRPVLLYAEKPVKIDALNKMVSRVLNKQLTPYQQVELLKPLSPYKESMLKHQVSLDEIMRANKFMSAEISKIAGTNNLTLDELLAFGVKSKYQNLIYLFDPHFGFLGAVPVRR